jgi:hypothetical protein
MILWLIVFVIIWVALTALTYLFDVESLIGCACVSFILTMFIVVLLILLGGMLVDITCDKEDILIETQTLYSLSENGVINNDLYVITDTKNIIYNIGLEQIKKPTGDIKFVDSSKKIIEAWETRVKNKWAREHFLCPRSLYYKILVPKENIKIQDVSNK